MLSPAGEASLRGAVRMLAPRHLCPLSQRGRSSEPRTVCADNAVVAVRGNMATSHDRSRAGGVLIEQRRLHEHASIGPIGLHARHSVFGDDAVFDANHVLSSSTPDRVDAVAAVVTSDAVNNVQSNRPVGGVDLYAATGVVGYGDVIECRIDAAAGARLEENPAGIVRYPAVSDHEIQMALRLDVERGAGDILKNAVIKNQSAAAGDLYQICCSAQPTEIYVLELEHYIEPHNTNPAKPGGGGAIIDDSRVSEIRS